MSNEISFDSLCSQNDFLGPYHRETVSFPSNVQEDEKWSLAQEEEDELNSEFAPTDMILNFFSQGQDQATPSPLQEQDDNHDGLYGNKMVHPLNEGSSNNSESPYPSSPGIEDLFLERMVRKQHMEQESGDTFMANLSTDFEPNNDTFLQALFSTVPMHQLVQSSETSSFSPTQGLVKDVAEHDKRTQLDSKAVEGRAVKTSSSSKRNTIAGVAASLVDPSRVWKTSSNGEMSEMSVMTKTRLDEPSDMIPDRLYSSLKYELQVTIPQSLSSSILHVKCVMVESETLQEVESEDALKGTTEAAMTRSASSDIFQGILKVQICNNLSHHKNGKQYRLEVRLFLPSDLGNAMMICRSPEFKVFARRPNKPKHLRKTKRKLDNVLVGDGEQSKFESTNAAPVRKKTKQPSANDQQQENEEELSLFSEKLDELLATANQLDKEARKKAIQLMFSRFLDTSHCPDDDWRSLELQQQQQQQF